MSQGMQSFAVTHIATELFTSRCRQHSLELNEARRLPEVVTVSLEDLQALRSFHPR
jgi:hypothetical protein